MRTLVIGHDHVGGLEHLGEELRARGHELTSLTVVPEACFSDPGVRVEFPDPSAWDLVVTLGAPWPRTRIATWSGEEIAFLRRALDVGVAVLGVCFGAQLLAEALGGGAVALGRGRVGWRTVRPRAVGIDPGPWFVWNSDQLVVPPGVEVLAEGPDGVEAFRAGRCAGVQFHPEMTAALLDRWLALPGGTPAGLDVAALRAETRRRAPAAAARVPALLDVLLGVGADPTGRRSGAGLRRTAD